MIKSAPSNALAQKKASSAPNSLDSTPLRRIPQPEEIQITLRIYSPVARKVFVGGTFNDWRVDATSLTNVGNGEWVLSLMLKPGTYEYRFIADDQWCDDPLATDRVKNPYGGWNSVLRVGPRIIRLPDQLPQ
jgi:1,4-alpha-glucan branching enzyme